jgi:MoaA/NifB/PqqE/SkfB family radical SAM enzyme
MSDFGSLRISRIITRTIGNVIARRPITVSYEVTYNCNARCEHCDLGDYVKEPRLEPGEFAGWVHRLKSPVVQISGGEPLLRKDIYDIIKAMRAADPVAVFVITTNSTILNEERYLRLREAGVDKFSLSLDYPDERHNTFRHLKGNFEHIRDLVPDLVKHGNNDIVLACVVQSDNFRDLPRLAELAAEWGVGVNFSTYNALRTDKQYYLVSDENDRAELSRIVDKLVEMQKEGYPILTSEWTMRRMIDFFATDSHPKCQAGRKFMIVNPWAKLTPCGMFRDHYDSREQLARGFAATNTCDRCFTAIRANSEKSARMMFQDALRAVRHRSPRNGATATN